MTDNIMAFRVEDYSSALAWVREALVQLDSLLEEAWHWNSLVRAYEYTPSLEGEYKARECRVLYEAECLLEAIWPLIFPVGR